MPNVLVHTLFAERTLEHWRETRAAPFNAADQRCRDAFVHGALGPDIGYFPGGDAILSELAHRLRTGSMASRLLASARTGIEIAFAWGWVTHMLADVRLHPFVNEAAASAAGAERAPVRSYWNGSRSPVDFAHLRIEVGLDIVFLLRNPATGQRLRPVFTTCGLNVLAAAFEDVYGPVTTPRELHAAHMSVAHWHGCLIPLMRWMSADWSEDGSGPARMVAPLLRSGDGRLLRYLGAGPVAAAFVSPLRPPTALVDRVLFELQELPRRIEEVRESPESLPDLDMEDGAPILESSPKPSAARTMAALQARTREREAEIVGERSRRAERRGSWPDAQRSATYATRSGIYSAIPLNPMTNDTLMRAIRRTP